VPGAIAAVAIAAGRRLASGAVRTAAERLGTVAERYVADPAQRQQLRSDLADEVVRLEPRVADEFADEATIGAAATAAAAGQGSGLTKTTRPLGLLSFILVVSLNYGLMPALAWLFAKDWTPAEIPDTLWIIWGGVVGGGWIAMRSLFDKGGIRARLGRRTEGDEI
jgi:hypothetical protein